MYAIRSYYDFLAILAAVHGSFRSFGCAVQHAGNSAGGTFIWRVREVGAFGANNFFAAEAVHFQEPVTTNNITHYTLTLLGDFNKIRITSYNVCYTKLLRVRRLDELDRGVRGCDLIGNRIDPLDRWSKLVIGGVAASMDATSYFPSDPPYP